MLFTGTSNRVLAEKIANILNMKENLQLLQIDKFLDKEILPIFKTSIRDRDIIFIQSLDSSDSIMETFLVADASRRSGVKSFTLVCPYLGYGRQDRNDHVRSSIGSALIAKLLTDSGITRIMTIDMHNGSTAGFFDLVGGCVHLNGNKIFIDYIKSLSLDNICIVSPDQGAVKKAIDFAKSFPDSGFALINKRRITANVVHSMELIGNVEGKNCIIVDDLGDSMGTICLASKLLMEKNASSCRAIMTHGVISIGESNGKYVNALENVYNSNLTELIVSDTIGSVLTKLELYNNMTGNDKTPKFAVISSADFIAKSLSRLLKNQSISEIN